MKKLLCKKHCQDKKDAKVFYDKGKIYEFEDKRADELLKAYNGEYFEIAKEDKKENKKDN